ncbi:outer membrane beta-barrel protein [Alteromonas sp. P256]|uniref:outer membrane beta-barrel protein n=1 Tax=Alteromonas sp. P256 TaxID=3117399 RepID=UPI002FE138DE
MKTHLLLASFVTLTLLIGAPLSFAQTMEEKTEDVAGGAPGSLFRNLVTESLEKDSQIAVYGWSEVTALSSSHGDSVGPAAFFDTDTGVNFNQLGLMVCKGSGCPPHVLAPTQNVLSRITPTPAPRGDSIEFGYNLSVVYGEDAGLFRTAGFDDNFGNEEGNHQLSFTQWYVDIYFPILDGATLILGSWHTSLANDIGYDFDPPNWFVSHTYAFQFAPAKHVGGLFQANLPVAENFGHLSLEAGVVRGWNTFDGPNNDLHVIGGARWRSPDMKTWVDFEFISGNGANDFGAAPNQGGSPIFALSENNEDLSRFVSYLVVTHKFTDKFEMALEGTIGSQEGGDFVPVPIFVTEDADWSGINLAGRFRINQALTASIRYEYFSNPDGAHVLWGGARGDVTSITANLSWQLNRFVRIRPELRYDDFSGDSNSVGLFNDGTASSQALGLLNVFVHF